MTITSKQGTALESSANPVAIGAAVTAQPGTTALAIAKRGRASKYLELFEARTQTSCVLEKCLAPALTLDLFVRDLADPILIKADLKVAELDVRQGAPEVLPQSHAVIAIEVRADTREDLGRFLLMLDPDFRDQVTGAAWPVDTADSTSMRAFPR